MPQIHRKICLGCTKEFESAGSKNCPYCGSDKWNFINDAGGVIMPIKKLLISSSEIPTDREDRAFKKKLDSLVERFHPELME